MSLLREVKPRNARTARIVKAREPQIIEGRKKVLFLHGSKCPVPVRAVLKTAASLTKPNSVTLNKKNGDIHPFEDPSSLEFLAMKNECGIVVFGTHSKKRPNNISLLRIFDNKVLDLVELLVLNDATELEQSLKKNTLAIGMEMKPLILFSGSLWTDESATAVAGLYRTLRSLFLDLFQGEEIASIDVAGLQYILMIATGEPSPTADADNLNDPASKPAVHLRWYKISTSRSSSPKIPRVELSPIGPSFDFRVGRLRVADESAMREAMKQARRPADARVKKNIETDLMGDKLGRVHLGKQDLTTLQTRKMKGLKRSREDDLDGDIDMATNGNVVDDDIDIVSQDDKEMEDFSDTALSNGSGEGTGDDIDIGDSDEEVDERTKRQRMS